MAFKEWTTNYPANQDVIATAQPVLVDDPLAVANPSIKGDNVRSSLFHALRTKSDALAARVGSDDLLPATSHAAWLTAAAVNIAAHGNSLGTAITAIGANVVRLMVGDGASVAVAADTTVPANISLHVLPGATITVATSMTLTINGPLIAGLYPIFAGAGSVRFDHGSITEVVPQWWGAAADNTADDRAAIQAALDSLPPLPGSDDSGVQVDTYGGIVKLSKGTFRITAPIVMKSYQWLVGSGPATILRNATNTSAAITVGDGTTPAFRVHIRDLTIQGSGTSGYVGGGYGIYAQLLYRSEIDHVWIKKTTDTGIYLKGAGYSRITDSYIEGCGCHGIYGKEQDGGSTFWITTVTVDGCTIRGNLKSGVHFVSVPNCSVTNNTIESNSSLGESIGYTGLQTAHVYYANMYLEGTQAFVVEGNYFEQGTNIPGGETAYAAHLVMGGGAGTLYNFVGRNSFNGNVGIGVFMWSANSHAVSYNYFHQNKFLETLADNFQSLHYSGHGSPSNNYLLDNIGLRWHDEDGATHNNTINAQGFADGLVHRIQTYTHTSGAEYAPTGGVVDDGSVSSGVRLGNVIEITLQSNITSFNAGNVSGGTVLYLVFIQDGTGSRTVTFNASNYKTAWSNVGGDANLRSSVVFYVASGGLYVQLGAQSPWM